MLIELHSHTHYSRGTKVLYDGVDSPEGMVKSARSKGIGMLAITDHNHTVAWKEARAAGKKHGVTIIQGEEITTQEGHVVALGISEAIPKGLSLEETLDRIREQGGFSIAAHPFDIKMDGMRKHARLCDAIEVFNPFNFDRISNWRARKFAESGDLIQVVGSDAHCKEMIGLGVIKADVSDVDGLIKALHSRSFQIKSAYPPISLIKHFAISRLRKSYGHTQNYIDRNYKFPKDFVATGMLKMVNMAPGHIDLVFDAMAYTSLGGVVAYSAVMALLDI